MQVLAIALAAASLQAFETLDTVKQRASIKRNIIIHEFRVIDVPEAPAWWVPVLSIVVWLVWIVGVVISELVKMTVTSQIVAVAVIIVVIVVPAIESGGINSVVAETVGTDLVHLAKPCCLCLLVLHFDGLLQVLELVLILAPALKILLEK